MQYLLAHDLGTSGNKATLFSEDGKMMGCLPVDRQGRPLRRALVPVFSAE